MARLFGTGFEGGDHGILFDPKALYGPPYIGEVIHKNDIHSYAPPYTSNFTLPGNSEYCCIIHTRGGGRQISLDDISIDPLTELYFKFNVQFNMETNSLGRFFSLFAKTDSYGGYDSILRLELGYVTRRSRLYLEIAAGTGTRNIDLYPKIEANVWHLFEGYVKLSTTTTSLDGGVELRLDGRQIYQSYGVNCMSEASQMGVMTFYLSTTHSNQYMLLDDVIIDSTACFDTNTADQKFALYLPSRTGVDNDFDTNPSNPNKYENINNVGNIDLINDTYIFSETPNEKQSFGLQLLDSTSYLLLDTINCVYVNYRTKKYNSGINRFQSYILAGSGNDRYDSLTFIPTYMVFWSRQITFEIDPNTGEKWLKTELDNNLEIGIESLHI